MPSEIQVGTAGPHSGLLGRTTPVLESQSDLWRLIRRAVSLLDRDRVAAWDCLRDAYTLLVQQSSGAPIAPQIAPAVRPGCLAAWQARRVIEYIEEHLGTKLTVEEIAAAIELSKSHFTRAFKCTLGASPMAYIAARRVERAKRMMITSTESLTEISLNCGFADQSHLNRHFRRAVGVAPGQWRRGLSARSADRVCGAPLPERAARWDLNPSSFGVGNTIVQFPAAAGFDGISRTTVIPGEKADACPG
ncbi:MAG TPA: AraC family transcriptional regulator [Steroidobacteraceae bacterium]